MTIDQASGDRPLAIGKAPTPATPQSSLVTRRASLVTLLAMVAVILGSSLYVRHGGYLHGETDMYLVAHLSDRPFLAKIMCPHAADARFYQCRQLSHALENLDAHFVYWSYLAGFPNFFSVTTYALLLGITGLHWYFGVYRLRFDRLTLLLMLALFWTNPNVYLAGMCLRAAKIAVAFFVYAGIWLFLSRMLSVANGEGIRIREPTVPKHTVFLYALLGLAACFSDPQGVFLVLLLSGVSLAWVAGLKSKEALLAALAGGAACGIHTLFRHWLAPILVQRWCGFEVTSAFHEFKVANLHTAGLEFLKEGTSLCLDTISFVFGNMPDWVFGPLLLCVLAAAFMLRTQATTQWARGKLKHPGVLIGLTGVGLLLANMGMCALMVAGHPPVAWADIRRGGYYGLPTAVLWFMVLTVLLRLLQDRFQLDRRLIWAALAVLLAFNVESLPTHCNVNASGHMQGFIEAAPSMLTELKRLRKEPAGRLTGVRFDAQKNCELSDFSTMLRNPLLDITTRGSIDVDAYLKSSRYLNFLRSQKGLDFYQPGQLKTQ